MVALLWAGASGTCREIELATDAPPPRTPEASQRLFQLPDGFQIELVASEPLLADPVAMAFDAQGRILVCEIHGYNLEGYYDVVELNSSGQLDTQVRRIPASEEAIQRAAQDQYGTVKLLEDADGDGRYERCSVWADRVPPCYGVVPARGGAVVLCAPHIFFLADRDGDGHAEVRETLFTGFGVGEMWTRINNPRWGIDNWIYGVSGAGSAGTISGPRLPGPVRLAAVCFRFKPDGSALEPASGKTHGFGQAVDDWGDRFLCTNQQHALHVIPIPHRYLARNPYYAAPALTRNISGYGHPARVYPTSKPDPWRRARAADPAWVRFYGEMEATANGYFTAASGPVVYSADQFPSAYHGNHFSVDNAQNLVHRCLLEPAGVSYTARRPQGRPGAEFLTSREQWFRPVNLAVGPDGALYVVDMYRDIIEDYSAIPRHLQQKYVSSLIAGSERGRIWRIVASAAAAGPGGDASARRASPASRGAYRELNSEARSSTIPSTVHGRVASLTRPNRWHRITAQRLLIEQPDEAAVGPLEELLRRGPTPQSRLHALYTLDGLDRLAADSLRHALADEHFAVRVHALRLADRRLDREPQLLPAVLRLVDDSHPRVRLQVALSLGQSESRRAEQALARLARHCGSGEWLAAAVLSSTVGAADRVLLQLLSEAPPAERPRALLGSLASVVGARGEAARIGAVLSRLSQLEPDRSGDQLACLAGLDEGLQRGDPRVVAGEGLAAGLPGLLTSRNMEVRDLAVRIAGRLKIEHLPEMQRRLQEARTNALDDSLPAADRQRAVTLLAAAPFTDLRSAAEQLLDPRQPIGVQLAVVEALRGSAREETAALLLRGFRSGTPRLQAAIIDAVFARQERLPLLLDAVERGDVPRASLDAMRREQLENNPRKTVARRARRLFSAGAGSPDRASVLARYRKALQLARDVRRGRKVYQDQCAKCHKLGEEGYEVGPDLLTARTRADETLLSDVLDPSNQITVGYGQYSIITADGRIVSGVLAAETATSVTLRAEEGKETVVLRNNIDEMMASTVSMMPEELEKEVSPQDLADLLAFLRDAMGPPDAGVVTLFDEEPAFASALNQGDGRARVERQDCYAGTISLAVTPPQRFSAQIPGWQFPIRKDPEPGEYRYLRFAWKQVGGEGIMLELAADGKWPAAGQPAGRYYSGRNTTPWQAVQIDRRSPPEWTVVTRDLWADFGPLTLTGIAPTAMGGRALFDKIELLRSLDGARPGRSP